MEGPDVSGIFLARPEQPGDGTPLAVKDLFDTAGLVTTYGSVLFADHVPDRTAEAVRRLEEAGYANVGKTNLHEFAYGVTSENPHFGTVPNPRAPGRVAGGSSGGSAAALAAGLVEAALGSDTGGSIRIPAACCGVVGFKPTFGSVPIEGCYPLAPSFDTAGPMGRTVSDCAAMLEALAASFEPTSLDRLDDVEIGVAWLEQADPLVRARVEEAAAHFPHRRELDFPLPDRDDWDAIFMREVAVVHEGLFPDHADAYGEDVRAKLERCFAVTEAEVDAGARALARYRELAPDMLAGVDLLVTPTLAQVAPPVRTREVGFLTRFTWPINGLGWPALALPCGAAEDGLPASIQLVGRAGDDALVLAAGEALERSLSLV